MKSSAHHHPLLSDASNELLKRTCVNVQMRKHPRYLVETIKGRLGQSRVVQDLLRPSMVLTTDDEHNDPSLLSPFHDFYKSWLCESKEIAHGDKN
jgi:hypothetical protein